MNQQTLFANIICVIFLNLKVIRYLGAFKQFMLYLLDDNIFSVEHDEDIAGSQVDGACPAFNRRVKRMFGGTGDRLAVYRYMDPFLGLVAEQPNNLF